MISLTNILPEIRTLNGFDPTYFKNREGVGHFIFIQETTKQYYIAKTINAVGYLRGIERVIKGTATNFGERLTNALLTTDIKDWSVYFYPGDMQQSKMNQVLELLKDYQLIRRHSTRAHNKEKTTWVYVVTHKESGRRFHILSDDEIDHEQAVGLFMRKWKQNNSDGLERKVISLGVYYQCMHDFQKAADSIEKSDFLAFDFFCVTNLQSVTRQQARFITSSSNRIDTTKYYQAAYNKSKKHVTSMDHNQEV